ncbi:MAG: YggS family pyridoxal phosphate-dependent enzyme [Verrucomicrobiaceae bacterium]|nr:MAG: YggS family pyridoxal phosphate-dependent enzyme [Verrucomicrobiaceae bacterium]
MSDIGRNLREIHERMEAACLKAGRDPSSVELVAVSKTFPDAAVREAADAGQIVFGESRQQEAAPKIAALPDHLRWHFIGRVQSNKVRKLLPLFDTIHAIDSLRLARHTAGVAVELGLFPKVFLQVNVGGEASKGGFEPDELEREIESLLAVERLDIQGLMTIPPPGENAEASRPWFVRLRELRDRLERRSGVKLPSLSMGMSGDFEVAIEEGATHVRVGSAIFGGRTYRVDGELG